MIPTAVYSQLGDPLVQAAAAIAAQSAAAADPALGEFSNESDLYYIAHQ